jgi:hypothetical protein
MYLSPRGTTWLQVNHERLPSPAPSTTTGQARINADRFPKLILKATLPVLILLMYTGLTLDGLFFQYTIVNPELQLWGFGKKSMTGRTTSEL